MTKRFRLSIASVVSVLAILAPLAQDAVAAPSSYSGSWDHVSRDGVVCTWSVYDRSYSSAVYPTYDQLKVTQSVSCNASVNIIKLGQDANWAHTDFGNWGTFATSSASNAVTGGSSVKSTTCPFAASCSLTTTWDAIPRGVDLAIDPQHVEVWIHSRSSPSTDYWTSAPCSSSVGSYYSDCLAPMTLTAP
jgi:hypothetical protein